MRVMSLALGGCIKGPPVAFGITEDTGGHITYALGAAMALSHRDDVDRVEIVTRLIEEEALGPAYAASLEILNPKLAIRRIATGTRAYLTKDANAADRPAFLDALLIHLSDPMVRPDIIHAHFADAAEIAIAVRKALGIPFIYTAHSLGIDKLAACGGSLDDRIALEARAIAEADAVIASSRDEAERQLMLYPGASPARIHCVPPGAALEASQAPDLARARDLVAPFLRDPAKPMLLAIARPVHKKNLAALIDLFAGDADLRHHCNLVVLAGLRDGPDSGEEEQRQVIAGLLERLDRHDLYGSLALPKRHGPHDVASLYALARSTGGLFINPALTEPYGLTLTEAASHGLPVVATIHGGPADIVERYGHGLVADPSDFVAFVKAIRDLLDDRAAWERASRQGARRAKELGWPGYAARFVQIATRTITARKPRMPQRPAFHDMLLSDIDHTLTGCRDGARALCRLMRERPSLGFGIATGRSLQEAERLLEEWCYPEPHLLITSVGSEIYWRAGPVLEQDHAFAQHIAQDWCPDAIVGALEGMTVMEPQPMVEQRRFKLSYFVQDDRAATTVRRRLAQAGLAAKVIHSHGRLLDVLPARAGKGAAMAWAAHRLGIPIGRIHAAGDSGNDLDMLEACPNAIVVANHEPALSRLRGSGRAYFAERAHAAGIVEALAIRFSGVSL